MSMFTSSNPKEKVNSGILGAFAVDVIKWEPESDREASVIAHKFEYEDFPNGSQLIVGPSQMAIFTNNLNEGVSSYNDGSGNAQMSVFVGPCRIKLETNDIRFAPFRNVAHKLTGGESAYHSTVYFINTTYMNELPWGTQSPVVVVDPEEDINVHVRAFGMYGAHIESSDTQARMFLKKVVGTRADYTREELEKFMRAKILQYVPDLLGKSIIHKGISVMKISAYLSEFSDAILQQMRAHFEEVGLTLDNFSFHSINVPDEDLRIVNEAKIQRKKMTLEAEGAAAKMDVESAARARMREREGYTYQQEQSFDVMRTAAANEGSAGNMMGTSMGLGMGFGIGDALGAGMGNIARNTIGQNAASMQQSSADTKTCPACGQANSANAKFCLNCGEKFATEGMVCPACGAKLPANAKFCHECGQKIETNCPDCGTKLPAGSKFCPECGKKF